MVDENTALLEENKDLKKRLAEVLTELKECKLNSALGEMIHRK